MTIKSLPSPIAVAVTAVALVLAVVDGVEARSARTGSGAASQANSKAAAVVRDHRAIVRDHRGQTRPQPKPRRSRICAGWAC
ncbi:MAG: hypothetical protein AB7O57_02485 [Hyphomicrobiaceae bacterium]